MMTTQSPGRAILGAALAAVTFGAGTAAAQVDYEVMSALQFNFSNPGARSLALAGALTGAGDDATGAWTNPGGLTNISKAEIGFEFRQFNYSTLFVDGGRYDGLPTNIGVDTLSSLTIGESNETTNSLSFVSAVVPRSRWAFAFYRTEVANFETALSTDGAFFNDPPPNRLLPVDGTLDIEIANYGGSAAFRLTDAFSVGVGLSYYDFSLDSLGSRYDAISTTNINLAVQPGYFFGPPLRTADNVVTTEVIEGDDSAFGVNVGVSINPSDAFRLGASYRQGPAFDISYARTVEGTLDAANDSQFNLPDVIAVGALIKPATALNITVDYRRVMYSQMTSDMNVVISEWDTSEDYVIDDANEIRLAGEFLFTNLPFVLAVRGGTWFDPDHRIRFEGSASNKADEILFPPGEDLWHVTGGAGLVFPKVQFDIGYDYSERVKTFSVSAIYRF